MLWEAKYLAFMTRQYSNKKNHIGVDDEIVVCDLREEKFQQNYEELCLTPKIQDNSPAVTKMIADYIMNFEDVNEYIGI